MPNIFGAGLLDILSQGGQFLGGRRQGQRDRQIEDDERRQKALEQALLARQREASIKLDQARTADLLAPPDEVNWYYDPIRGVQISPRTGAVRALTGLPERPPTAPVAGTPEAEAWLRTTKQIESEFNPPKDPSDRGLPTISQALDILRRKYEIPSDSYIPKYSMSDDEMFAEAQAMARGKPYVPDIAALTRGAMRGSPQEVIARVIAKRTQATQPTAPTPVTPVPQVPAPEVAQEVMEAQEAVAQGMPADQVWSMMSPAAQAQIGDPSGLAR